VASTVSCALSSQHLKVTGALQFIMAKGHNIYNRKLGQFGGGLIDYPLSCISRQLCSSTVRKKGTLGRLGTASGSFGRPMATLKFFFPDGKEKLSS